ncbi:MAG: NAD(P)-binding oxidoreductase [Bacteroidota bacterium]
MNVLVIGSTGGTGRALVQALLDAGHGVTAFARAASPEPPFPDGVRLVQGNALAPADLDRAVPGHDAVVVSLGLGPNPLVIRFGIGRTSPLDVASRGTANVLAAMERHGVRRLAVVSAFGTAESWATLPAAVKAFMWLFLKPSFDDKAVQEAAVRQSDTDWTILRPVQLTNGPATGRVSASLDGEVTGAPISRADVAAYAVRTLADAGVEGQTVALSGPA